MKAHIWITSRARSGLIIAPRGVIEMQNESVYIYSGQKRVNFLFLRTNTDSVKGRLSIAIDEFSKTEGRRHVNMASTHGQLTNGMDSGMIHTAWQDVQTNEGTNRRGGRSSVNGVVQGDIQQSTSAKGG